MKALFGWLLKSGSVTSAPEPERTTITPTEAPDDYAIVILVAAIEGKDGASISSRIADGFASLPKVGIKRTEQTVMLSGEKSESDDLIVASEQGRDLLFQHGADVLVWGGVNEAESTVHIRFLSLNPAPEGRPGAIDGADVLELPVPLSADMEDLVIACAVAAGALNRTGSKTDAMTLVHDYTARVRRLVDSGLENLAPRQRLSALINIANVVATDSRGEGGTLRLQDAVTVYRKAIGLVSSDTPGVQQARLHSHLAVAFQSLAVDDRTAGSLENVVASYQATIASLQKTLHAREWGQAHVGLGLAFYRLALKSDRAKLMKESVLAFREALTVFSKEASPGKWADVMNHIGVVMTAMGEEINNNGMLEQALKIFNETLVIRRRETAPILWAQTNNNMGASAFALAKRIKDKALMEQAAMAFESAAEVYRGTGQVQRVQVIEKNIALVQRRMEAL